MDIRRRLLAGRPAVELARLVGLTKLARLAELAEPADRLAATMAPIQFNSSQSGRLAAAPTGWSASAPQSLSSL